MYRNNRTMHRFYLPPDQTRSGTLILADAEAHHLLHVLRGKIGDRVTVFDGAGHELACTISRIEKGRVNLQVMARHSSPVMPYHLVLAQAVPKARSMDLILQKATELGAKRIVPLLSDRTIVQIEADDIAGKVERWNQITIEAAKQCGANWLPVVEAPTRPRDFFPKAQGDRLKLIASLQPDSLPLWRLLENYMANHECRPKAATVVIGPEGDFTPAELADARSAGFGPLSLGPLVLRSETAAIYALSILAYELQREITA
jgi:16S rRNA (uracil1498-N3)-methyltransferase